MPLLLVLVLLMLAEIALFVAVGGVIGVWGVLGLVVLSALAGVAILRGRLARIGVLLRAGDDPARLLAQGAFTAMGAMLLILPGFLTDAVGLLLLVPPVQRLITARIAPRAHVRTARWDGVIEGEFVVEDPPGRASDSAPHPDRPRLPPGH